MPLRRSKDIRRPRPTSKRKNDRRAKRGAANAILLAPSILSADHARLREEITAAERAGADWIHLDVMDGHFVPNLTFGPPIIKSLRKVTKLPFDVHLMIERPELSIEQYVEAGADHLTVHPEATVHLHRTLTRVRELGARAGVALNPSTPLSSIVHVLHMVDLVLVMTVNPGFGGQSFIAEVLPKLAALRALIEQRNLAVHIVVDGGVDATTAEPIAAAGADVLVSGSAVFGSRDYAATMKAIRAAAEGAAPVVGVEAPRLV